MICRGPFQAQPFHDSLKIITAGLILELSYSWMLEFKKNPSSNSTVLYLMRMLSSLAAGDREGRWMESLWEAAKAECQSLVSVVPESWNYLELIIMSPGSLKFSLLPLLWNDNHCITCCGENLHGMSFRPASSYWLGKFETLMCCCVLYRAISGQWALDPCKGTLGRMFVCLFMLCQWLPFFLCHFSAVRHFLMKAKHERIQRHSITMQCVRRKRELFQ